MRHLRYWALGGLIVVTIGSLAATGGYAWYLRSALYRDSCAAHLSEALGLPSDIGCVMPRSWTAREFDDISVWLPGRRGKALTCDSALVLSTPRHNDPEAYELDLRGGACEISTRTWLREDYRRVIESGLRPGFDPGGPRRVRFASMNLRFERDRFRGSLEDASGTLEFDDLHTARAGIACRALNGYVTREPVVLEARFSPRDNGIQIDRLELTVPYLPLSVLGLGELVGVDVHSGTFNGRLSYSEAEGVRCLGVSGTCFAVSLAEWTAGLTTRPWTGSCGELDLEELAIENGRPQRLRFRGVLAGVVLGDVLAPWGLEGMGGELVLRVRQADLSTAGVERLVASGDCADVSLAALTEKLGGGVMSGRARLIIGDLTIEKNRLRSLDAELRIEEDGEPKWIEGRLLTNVLGKLLGVELPAMLPEQIEYTQLGVRLDVRDEALHVFGTHGPRGKTILTVRLLDRPMPLLVEPERSFDLSGWLDVLRKQAADYVEHQLDMLALRHDRAATSSAPAVQGGAP